MLKLKIHIGILCLLLMPIGGIAQSLQLADTLRVKGENYQELGNFKEAEFYYSEAYNLYKAHQDTASFLITAVYYSEILSYRSKIEEAINLLNEVKSIPHPSNNDSLKARIESDLGWAYNRLGDRKAAIEYYKKGLQYSKKANYTLMIGICLNNLANTYYKENNAAKAISYYQEALSLFKNLDNLRSQSVTLSNIGSIYKQNFLFDKALEYFNRSLEINEQLDNVNMLGSIYNKIGGLYIDTGTYDQALMALQKSLEYHRQANNIQSTASTLNQIGMLYRTLGDSRKALEYYQEGLSLWKLTSNPYKISVAHKNIGVILWDLGQKEEAIDNYNKALSLKRETGDSLAVATSLLDLAKVSKAQNDIGDAFDYLRQARAIAVSSRDTYLLKETWQQLGDLILLQGDAPKALTHYKKALNYSHSLEKNARLGPIKQLAYAHDVLVSDSALYYGRQAINLIEEGRTHTGVLSQFKSGYFKQHVDFYIAMAAWKLKYDNDTSGAYSLIESAKARALSDELSQAARRTDESLPENERIKRSKQLADITGLYSQLKGTPDSQTRQLKNEIREKELTYASFENNLHQKYPQYKQLKSPKPVSLAQTQEMCDSETAVLEYAVSNGRLLIFFISRNNVRAKQFTINERGYDEALSSDLAGRVSKFRDAILNRAPEDSIQVHSNHLYNQLIKPFETELAPFKNIIIVPDGVLAYLPFEALTNKANYLVSQFNIKYAPSITGFSLIREPRQPSTKKLLAIANSSSYSSSSETPLLPSVELEVESVSKLFRNKTMLKDRGITEENVKRSLQQDYSFIHVAAHSVIDEQNSSMSGIVLNKGDSETGIGNDGYLRSSEIYGLNINSNMVVLSACESGIGALVGGEGILGLQRAFFNAGASTVVVSLWDVYDRSTTHFMKTFYQSLMERDRNQSWSDSWQSLLRWSGWDASVPFGKTAPSMRAAKLAMLEHPKYRHPVYWAPFVVVGR